MSHGALNQRTLPDRPDRRGPPPAPRQNRRSLPGDNVWQVLKKRIETRAKASQLQELPGGGPASASPECSGGMRIAGPGGPSSPATCPGATAPPRAGLGLRERPGDQARGCGASLPLQGGDGAAHIPPAERPSATCRSTWENPLLLLRTCGRCRMHIPQTRVSALPFRLHTRREQGHPGGGCTGLTTWAFCLQK